MRRRAAPERAQASAELVAVVPLLLVSALLLAQGLVAGWALLSAGEAARSAARIAHVGGDAKAAAGEALPDALAPGKVWVEGASIEVEVHAPALLPGVPEIPVQASASLDPGSGG